MSDKATMPKNLDLMWPTLCALETLGGSASLHELDDQVSTDLGLTDEVLEVLHGDGPQTKFANNCGWARTKLRKVGAVNTTGSGIWTITEFGRLVQSEDVLRELEKEQRRSDRSRRTKAEQRGGYPAESSELEDPDAASEESGVESWQGDLIRTLLQLKPDSFERLCQRLLREHGFDQVKVTGRSGDGGIDGTGVLRVNLLSFHVIYQCKRYKGTVGPGSIRDFRGALAGRADKGLFITTGTFSKEAKREADRDGATAIDLIDGEKLCKLLEEKHLGVVKETVIKPSFFDEL